jgi:hypothetical protein
LIGVVAPNRPVSLGELAAIRLYFRRRQPQHFRTGRVNGLVRLAFRELAAKAWQSHSKS